jgi:hypothetical protein
MIAVRNSPVSKEANSEYPAVAVMTGIGLLLFQTIRPAISVGPPAYGMVHYSSAASR